jgi:hypothetical protein
MVILACFNQWYGTLVGFANHGFLLVDRFSRLVRFIPMYSSASGADVTGLFFEHWLCKFGVPPKIVCDRDVRFQSAFGNIYVSVLIHVWLCLLRTILIPMGLQRDVIGLLNKYFVVTALLSSCSGVSIWHNASLL